MNKYTHNTHKTHILKKFLCGDNYCTYTCKNLHFV